MLKPFQKAYLKKLANPISHRYLIGKGGLDDKFVAELNDALEARELIKVGILQNASCEPKQIAEELAERLNADLVQVIGRVMVYYRKSKKNPKIGVPTRD